MFLMYENVLILDLVQAGFSNHPTKSILIISMQLKLKRELYKLTSILIYETNQHTLYYISVLENGYLLDISFFIQFSSFLFNMIFNKMQHIEHDVM